VARRSLPTRAQVELSDCGAACLAIVLEFFGRYVPLDELRAATGTGRDGVSALRLVDVARNYGLDARGVKTEVEDLRGLPAGTILFWAMNHFVVLESVGRRGLVFVDPALGRRRVAWDEVDRDYSGTALLLEPGADFVTAKRSVVHGMNRYVRPLMAQGQRLRQTVVVSLLLRMVGLALPLLTAALIDRVLPVDARALLVPLALVMTVMVGMNFVAAWLRSRLLLDMRVQVDYRSTLAFLEHLVSLPLTFHQRREAGDLVMRLRSNAVIRETLTNSALSAVLDGGFAVLYLVLLLRLSASLTIVAAIVGVVQLGVVVASQRAVQRLTSESIRVEARSQSYAYQLLAGMPTLKASGTEQRAVEEFTSRFVDELVTAQRKGRLTALLDSANTTVALAGPLVLLTFSVLQVLDGHLRLGAALAANALAVGFLTPLTSLVGMGSSLLVIRSYIERLDDVFEALPEQAGAVVKEAPELRGALRAEAVSFQYSRAAPFVVEDVSVDVRPGKMLAIVGPSGSGKTTLAHVLVGLYPPARGEVYLDDEPLSALDVHSVRRQLGVVTQDPYLFATTLRENIAFGRPDATLEEVVEAAECAQIAQDIVAMPMQFDTIAGEGGGSLSGGQRQRIAIARALCSRPRILLLDEATSHLDVVTEAAVHRAIDALGCTRIVIAHRLSTVARADKILVMDRGKVVQQGTHRALLARKRGLYAALVAGQS
jgi:ABC-type bacteriocin/lantibiotic exporter with double-glycine peptidase domain